MAKKGKTQEAKKSNEVERRQAGCDNEPGERACKKQRRKGRSSKCENCPAVNKK